MPRARARARVSSPAPLKAISRELMDRASRLKASSAKENERVEEKGGGGEGGGRKEERFDVESVPI